MREKNIIFIVAISLLGAGCAPKLVLKKTDLAKASTVCARHGGLAELSKNPTSVITGEDYSILCGDRTLHRIGRIATTK